MAITLSPRLGIRRWSSSADAFTRAQLDADHGKLDDVVVMFAQGTLAARPAAGTNGRLYEAEDVGLVYYDTGTGWIVLNEEAGIIKPIGGTTAPNGTLLLDGSVKDRAAYPRLFAAIGTTHNTGGETASQFRLPDARDRSLIGASASRPVGSKGGSETGSLTVANLPSHSHPGSSSSSAGDHSHTISTVADHTHANSTVANHTHSLSTEGDHAHTINSNGAHTHTNTAVGDHTHTLSTTGSHTHYINADGAHTHGINGSPVPYAHEHIGAAFVQAAGSPNPITPGPVTARDNAATTHTHTMTSAGSHQHSANPAGDHTHTMGADGGHNHTMTSAGSHAHTMSTTGDHSHTMGAAGSHTHTMSAEGGHNHTASTTGAHTHTITVAAQGSGTAFAIMGPWLAVNHVITF